MTAEETLLNIRARLEVLLRPDVARCHDEGWNDALQEVLRWTDGRPLDPELAETISRALHPPAGLWVTPE